jgi:hypothetical protein
MPGLALSTGVSNWQSVAAANGIENARMLTPGQLIDLNTQAPQLGASLGVQAGLAVSGAGALGVSANAELDVGR